MSGTTVATATVSPACNAAPESTSRRLQTVRSIHEPRLAGYRVLGEVSDVRHPRWSDWVIEQVRVRRPRQCRVSGGRVKRQPTRAQDA